MSLWKGTDLVSKYRSAFIDASETVLDNRRRFDEAFEAAQTDEQRFELGRQFQHAMARAYADVDRILDAYNARRQ